MVAIVGRGGGLSPSGGGQTDARSSPSPAIKQLPLKMSAAVPPSGENPVITEQSVET